MSPPRCSCRAGSFVVYICFVVIETSAPTRIDLAGGTIDIWPLYLFHPGAQTLNAAISLRARARVESRSDDRIVIRSEDTGVTVETSDWRELRDRRELRLLSLLVYFFQTRGITLTTSSESPAGAGLAGSSALNVAVCAALADWNDRHYDPEALLQIAMNVEAQTIAVPTGLQDYRPALYGGIAALELDVDGIHRVPLEVDVRELESRIVLCYTGEPRNSGTNNWEITKKHIDGDRHVFDCFERIRDTASAMASQAPGLRPQPPDAPPASTRSRCGGFCPTPHNRHQASHPGSAISTTLRRRSISAACRRATA